MIKEINYPIKYAILEVKKEGGWAVGYKDISLGFVVSKCFVVESNIVYHSNGSSKITHKVVFPFENISCMSVSAMNHGQNIVQGNIPSYDADNRPYPVNIVSNLFDSYGDAKNHCKRKNEECRNNLILRVDMGTQNWQEEFKRLKQEFDQKIELCNVFEILILEATEDMKISPLLPNSDQEPFVKILKPVKKQI